MSFRSKKSQINQAVRRLNKYVRALKYPYRLRSHLSQLELIFDSAWYRRQGGEDLEHYLAEGWKERLDPGPLFSTHWYLEAYPDVAQMNVCPLLHYLLWGINNGRDPNPLFSGWWYLRENADLADGDLSALMHYAKFGAKEGRAPSPLFDPVWYVSRNPGVAVEDALAHYRAVGWRSGCSPHPLFDVQWYQTAYPEACPGRDPIEHYLLGGWKEGHRPNPLFNPLWYQARYPDSRWLEPLTHYLAEGQSKCYPPSILFDEDYYRQINSHLAKTENPLINYFDWGWQEGYDPHPLFDGTWYRSEWQKKSDRPEFGSLSPIGHYLIYGMRYGVNPSPLFDAVWYQGSNRDVVKANMDPLEHYVAYGEAESRPAFPREPMLCPVSRRAVDCSKDWPIPIESEIHGKNLVMLACHDQRGSYGAALRHMVRGYHEAGWQVLLGFDHLLDTDAFANCGVDERPDGVLATPHRGYDFFSWRLMWESLPAGTLPARVLLSNDSVIGPIKPLDHLTKLIEVHPAEVLGFVESYERIYHLQSWGIVFQGRPVHEGALWRYLSQVNEDIDKQHLIGRMEVRLARWAATQGYAVGSIASPVAQIDTALNPSIFGWRRLLELGVPFLKREVFTLPARQIGAIPADVLNELAPKAQADVVSLITDSLAQIGVADQAPALSDWNKT